MTDKQPYWRWQKPQSNNPADRVPTPENPRTRTERLRLARVLREPTPIPDKMPIDIVISGTFLYRPIWWSIGIFLVTFCLCYFLAKTTLGQALAITSAILAVSVLYRSSTLHYYRRLEEYKAELFAELDEYERKKDDALR